MQLHRRRFLESVLATLGGQPQHLLASQRGLDPAVIGANPYFPGYDLYHSIGILHGLGFQTIELHPMGSPEARPGMPPGFEFDRISEAEKRRLKEALTPFRYVSTHLPWVDTPYFSPFEPSHEFGLRRIEIAMQASAFVGAEVANIHVQRSAHIPMEEAWPTLVQTFRHWGELASDLGFKLAIETGYPESVKEFVRLVHEVDHEQVGATIDVGHQKNYAELQARVEPDGRGTPEGIRAYNDITHQLIDELGSKVFHMHVHDIEPDTWAEHKPLVHGFVDYPRLIAKLRKVGYQGLLVFEIGGSVEELPGFFRDAKAKLEEYIGASR